MVLNTRWDDLAQLEGNDPRVGAFFDLDHTVLHGSSGMLFTRHMWRRGLMSTRQVLAILWDGLLYALGRADFTASARRMIRMFAGMPLDEMWQRSRQWFDEVIAPRLTQEARRRIAQHRARHHQVAILSAASPFVTVPAAEALGLHASDAICTQVEVLDGKLTGHVIEPMCFGEGKAYWARRYAAERDIDVERSFFYTDSYRDLPMLRIVGHPIAVNPDPRLRRLARQEGWPILRFY